MAESPKSKGSLRSQLLFAAATLLLFASNGYLAITGAGEYVLELFLKLGGWGALAALTGSLALFFLLLPSLAWFRTQKGHPLYWCSAWNAGVLIVVLGFAPVKPWFQHHGAMIPALALGEDSWLVHNLCLEKLGWHTGFDQIQWNTEVPAEAQELVQRARVIMATLTSARTVDDLRPVVASSNLQTVSAWPAKKQYLALRQVSNKIELLNLDASHSKRQWRLTDFNQDQQSANLTWQARDLSGRSPTLVKTLVLTKEDGQWKADFTEDIEAFHNKMLQRESSHKSGSRSADSLEPNPSDG